MRIDAEAGRAGLVIEAEDSLEALCPEPAPGLIRGHRSAAFRSRRLLRIRDAGLPTAPPPLSRCHPCAIRAVRREDTVETGEFGPRSRHQGRQARVKQLSRKRGDFLNPPGIIRGQLTQCVAQGLQR